jgi:hypothetical protein
MKAEGHRGMLALVIVLGVIIAVGLVVVIGTIFSRLYNAARSGDGAAATDFDAVNLPITDGCQVVETAIDGDRLALRLGTGGRCNQLLIVDLASGALIGRINLVPAP